MGRRMAPYHGRKWSANVLPRVLRSQVLLPRLSLDLFGDRSPHAVADNSAEMELILWHCQRSPGCEPDRRSAGIRLFNLTKYPSLQSTCGLYHEQFWPYARYRAAGVARCLQGARPRPQCRIRVGAPLRYRSAQQDDSLCNAVLRARHAPGRLGSAGRSRYRRSHTACGDADRAGRPGDRRWVGAAWCTGDGWGAALSPGCGSAYGALA